MAILISLNELLNPYELGVCVCAVAGAVFGVCVCVVENHIHIHAWMTFFCTPGTCLIKGRHSWEIIIKGFAGDCSIPSPFPFPFAPSTFPLLYPYIPIHIEHTDIWIELLVFCSTRCCCFSTYSKLLNLNNAQVAWINNNRHGLKRREYTVEYSYSYSYSHSSYSLRWLHNRHPK